MEGFIPNRIILASIYETDPDWYWDTMPFPAAFMRFWTSSESADLDHDLRTSIEEAHQWASANAAIFDSVSGCITGSFPVSPNDNRHRDYVSLMNKGKNLPSQVYL